MTMTHAIFLSRIIHELLWLMLNSKLNNSSSAKPTTQNSKLKIQNSFIEHESLESNEYLDRIYD